MTSDPKQRDRFSWAPGQTPSGRSTFIAGTDFEILPRDQDTDLAAPVLVHTRTPNRDVRCARRERMARSKLSSHLTFGQPHGRAIASCTRWARCIGNSTWRHPGRTSPSIRCAADQPWDRPWSRSGGAAIRLGLEHGRARGQTPVMGSMARLLVEPSCVFFCGVKRRKKGPCSVLKGSRLMTGALHETSGSGWFQCQAGRRSKTIDRVL